ncbi:Coiled-coil domain-containing protein 86 [Pseudolycoriella hygida]|uniref:Coiled-coil domain-containing protein 86 n=1 Tax=Pseudolycoriella hygida TaxID=35572 RepID=A0A9Q0MTT1_9DIPT|nr:Coiled-coil domain-containing protein 86 [Pseudolycoriella hygida]
MVLPEETTAISKSVDKINKDVANILNEIKRKNTNDSESAEKPAKQQKLDGKPTKPKPKAAAIPRGKPKSNRPWKEVKQKFSKIKKSIFRPTKDKKEDLRNELKHIKELSRTIKENRKQENEMKRQRREENARKKLENERKSEIVQVINNPAKLKRMKKKALRKIEKRDLANIKKV